MAKPLFEISEDLNKAEEISTFMLFALEEDIIPIPKLSLTQLLMAKGRSGLNPEHIAARIISRFPEIGIPSGPLNNGYPNVMEYFVKVITEEFIDAIQSDMRIDVAVDAGIYGTGQGVSAGGPVTTLNTSLKPHTGVGVAR
jgi:hypothetical protein